MNLFLEQERSAYSADLFLPPKTPKLHLTRIASF